MSKSEADLRKEQAIERLIRLQAAKAVQQANTRIAANGVIVTGPPPKSPGAFSGQGNRLGRGDGGQQVPDLGQERRRNQPQREVIPPPPGPPPSNVPQASGEDDGSVAGPGGPPMAQARKIKQSIDQACLATMAELTQGDPESPFVKNVDAILTETAKLIQEQPNQFRAPNYELQKKARLADIKSWAALHREIRDRAQQVRTTAKLDDGAPEVARMKAICDKAGADISATPDQRETIKTGALGKLEQIVAIAKTRAAIEKALADASGAIIQADATSVFLGDLATIRNEIAQLISQGSDEILAPEFETTQVERIGALPTCATAYRELKERATTTAAEIRAVWDDAPELDQVEELCDQARDDMRERPADSAAVKVRALEELTRLERAAKVGWYDRWIQWVKTKYGSPPKYPNGKVKNLVGERMLAYLTEYRAEAARYPARKINVEFDSYVWPGVWAEAPREVASPKIGATNLRKVKRSEATGRGLRIGRASVRGAKETTGADRANGVNLLFTGGLTNQRGGYNPQVFHWHVAGGGSDNMIFHQDGTLLGFVDGHIDRTNPTAQRDAKRCEDRYTDDAKIDVVVEGGELCEVING